MSQPFKPDSMAHIDISGKTFGRWTVINRTSQLKKVTYTCRCECGTIRDVLSASLRSGKSVSCGCIKSLKKGKTIYATSRGAYVSWAGMKQRCDYNKHSEYHRYGGRGITYDPAWKDFAKFLADMGDRPEGTSLDRIDNNKNYCKENCKWSTRVEQSSNTCRTVFVDTAHGKISLKQFAKHIGVSYDALHKYHRTLGMPIDEAIIAVRRSNKRA